MHLHLFGGLDSKIILANHDFSKTQYQAYLRRCIEYDLQWYPPESDEDFGCNEDSNLHLFSKFEKTGRQTPRCVTTMLAP